MTHIGEMVALCVASARLSCRRLMLCMTSCFVQVQFVEAANLRALRDIGGDVQTAVSELQRDCKLPSHN